MLLQIDYFERSVASQTPKKVADVGELFRENKLAFGRKERRPQAHINQPWNIRDLVMELLQIGIFKIFVAAKTPKKYQGALKLLFLAGKKFGFMQIPSLSSELHGPQDPRWAGGGSPSPNFPAYSQLDEMPHVHCTHIVFGS